MLEGRFLFPAEELVARRERVFRRIGNGVAVVQGGGACRGFELFRQTNELHYLCGVELPQAHLVLDEAAAEMSDRIAATRFSKPIFEQAARRALEFKGHLSHPVGMAVHDVGRYWERPLEPGLVFALDPQMWAPEEQLYIRVEDTVVITMDGVETLTPDAPLELDDAEAWMREPGMLQRFPALDG